MKKYPPFCIHFYRNKVTDFPVCSPDFRTEREALDYAANHYLDFRFVRLGFWNGLKNPDRYFVLKDVDSQVSML